MSSRPQVVRTSIAIAALLLPAGLARAQGLSNGPIGPIAPIQGRQMPVPAARSNDIEPASTQMRADTHTLASIETLGMGSLGALTSFVDPSFRFSQSGQTGTTTTSNGTSSLGMNLAFDHNWSRSRLTGFYNGAKVLYYPNSVANAAYHNFGIAEELHLDRWVFRIREDLMSSPEATLGGTDIGGLVLSNNASVLNGLQPTTGASDTILTQRARRLQNTASGELNYHLSRRSIVTGAGSYASLTFADGGFIDTHRIGGRFGYDYLLSPKNTIGLIYDYSRTSFGAISPHLQTDSVQLSFGRRLTGRLAFQVMGGPQKISQGTGSRQLTWTVSNNIQYQTRRTGYSLAYSHSSAGGSGVFSGASNHTIGGNVHYALSQGWSASTGAGYAFNQNLAPTTGTVAHFGAWYGSAALERVIGRHLHFALNYGFQLQNAGSGVCPVAGCGSTASRQTVGVTVEWHPMSIRAR
jgi:hypothetical protein